MERTVTASFVGNYPMARVGTRYRRKCCSCEASARRARLALVPDLGLPRQASACLWSSFPSELSGPGCTVLRNASMRSCCCAAVRFVTSSV
jgi:hypothetical protein